MKSITNFLVVALALVHMGPAVAVVPTTAGNNLTAYNGNAGAMNNNAWNTMMNSRATATGTPATADFSNCNAVVLRCAQPKCASGGCTTMDIASSIVAGCIQSNDSCQKYEDDLIQYISAQLVANSTARANAQTAAAQTAAAQAAAQQNAQQLQAMQQQMQQMQQTMAQQNAETVAQLQNALTQQKELTAQALADAQSVATANVQPTATATSDTGLTATQVAAAASGVSADVLARQQITGQIYEKIENAETHMKSLQSAMRATFTYAGCSETTGNNCTGPKRARAFKQRALKFFDPYNNVLDELYDALIMAQSVGVDISDIYMMLNGTCNAWAQYVCGPGQVMHYSSANCPDGKSRSILEMEGGLPGNEGVIGGQPCKPGQVVPMSDGGCQLVKMLTDKEQVRREWLNVADGDDGNSIRIGCASEALDNSALFRNRKKQASIDIDTLQRMIEQDAPASAKTEDEIKKYCYAANQKEELQNKVTLKQIGDKICTTDLDKATAATCSDDSLYVLPQYAMCTTHVYNIGESDNKNLHAKKRQEMRDIMALKATIMTQQLKAQYDYLDATMRRLKTQLEKAILTTNLAAAGANSSDSSSGRGLNTSNDRGIQLAGARNCDNENTTNEVFTCLRQNYSFMYSMYSGGNITQELKKQVANDVAVAYSNAKNVRNEKTDADAGIPYVNVDGTVVDCRTVREIKGQKEVGACLSRLNVAIRMTSDSFNQQKNQSQDGK